MKLNITLIASLFLLSACGGGEEGSSNTPSYDTQLTSSLVSLYAQDTNERTKIAESKQINFSRKVVLSDASDDFSIVSVVNKGSDSCQLTISDDKKSVSVTSDEVADCIYQYTVEAKSGKSGRSSAHLRVGVGRNYSDNTLPTITDELNLVSQSSLQVNVIDELAILGQSLTGYELNDLLVVIGEGSADVVDAQAGIIEYIANNAEPNATIYYSLEKDLADDEKDIKLGTLIISVSDAEDGQNLQARDSMHVHLDSNGKYQLIGVGDEIAINVRKYLTTNDEVTLNDAQLVAVASADATVFSIFDTTMNTTGNQYDSYIQNDEDEFNNKTFLFKASRPGSFDIVYTVTDHNGNYDNGILRLTVYIKDDIFSLQGWGTIEMTLCDLPSEEIRLNWHDFQDRKGNYSDLPSGPIEADDYCSLYYKSKNEPYKKTERLIPTRFTPPLSQALADYLGINYRFSWFDDNTTQENIVRLTYFQAVDYCANIGGRLPTMSEMLQMRLQLKNTANPSLGIKGDVTDYGWPGARRDDDSVTLFHWTMDRKAFDSTKTTGVRVAASTEPSPLYQVPSASFDPEMWLDYGFSEVDKIDSVWSQALALSIICVMLDDNEDTLYAPVKDYTVETTITPDPEVGIKYKLESQVIDPYGVESLYQYVTYRIYEDTGHFVNDIIAGNGVVTGQQNVQVVHNLKEPYQGLLLEDYYYDTSYNKGNILVEFGGKHVDTVTADPRANNLQDMYWADWNQTGSATDLPGGNCVGVPYCWKRLSYTDANPSTGSQVVDDGPVDIHGTSYSFGGSGVIKKEGLPLWIMPRTTGTWFENNTHDPLDSDPSHLDYLGYKHTAIRNVSQYTRPYYGEDFMMRIKISQEGELTPLAGRVVFSFHQPNDPKKGMHSGRGLYADAVNPHEESGGKVGGYYYGLGDFTPGIMCKDYLGNANQGSQLAFVYDYYNQNFVIRNGCQDADILADQPLKGLRNQYTYLWIRYENDPTTYSGGKGPKSGNGRVQVYASNTSLRPEDPIFDITGDFGWKAGRMTVGPIPGGSSIGGLGEVHEDYPYYFMVAVRGKFDPYFGTANNAFIEELNISTWDKEDLKD